MPERTRGTEEQMMKWKYQRLSARNGALHVRLEMGSDESGTKLVILEPDTFPLDPEVVKHLDIRNPNALALPVESVRLLASLLRTFLEEHDRELAVSVSFVGKYNVASGLSDIAKSIRGLTDAIT